MRKIYKNLDNEIERKSLYPTCNGVAYKAKDGVRWNDLFVSSLGSFDEAYRG